MKALIGIVGFVVLALTAVTIIVGTRTFEGTVVDKPYEAGLAWDAERRNRAELGWSASLAREVYAVGEDEILVEAFDRDHRPLTGAAVTIGVSRPSTNAYDKSYPAVARKEGGYLAKASLPLQGAWDIAIGIAVGGKSTSFTETVRAR